MAILQGCTRPSLLACTDRFQCLPGMHSPQHACILLLLQTGEDFVFTVRDPATVEGQAIGVSYAAFVDDVQVGHADWCWSACL